MSKDDIQIALVDDAVDSHDRVGALFGKPARPMALKGVSFQEDLCGRIVNSAMFEDAKTKLSAVKGRLILLLDMDLGQSEELRRQLRHQIIEILLPLTDADGLQARSDVENKTGSGQHIEAYDIALTAIRNTHITDLLIWVQTQKGWEDSHQHVLRQLARACGRTTRFHVYEKLGSLNARKDNSETIIRDAVGAFRSQFDTDRLERFLTALENLRSHSTLNWRDLAAPLAAFLGWSESELALELRLGNDDTTSGRRRSVIMNGIRSLLGNSTSASRLSAVGAWLLALAAYRKQYPSGNWRDYFTLSHLLGKDLSDNLLTARRGLTGHCKAIEAFFALCECLCALRLEGETRLESVVLTPQKGFRLLLHQDLALPIEGKRLDRWLSESAEGDQSIRKAGIAGAIWAFWMNANLVDWNDVWERNVDTSGDEWCLIGAPDVWRLHVLRRPNGKTEIIFHSSTILGASKLLPPPYAIDITGDVYNGRLKLISKSGQTGREIEEPRNQRYVSFLIALAISKKAGDGLSDSMVLKLLNDTTIPADQALAEADIKLAHSLVHTVKRRFEDEYIVDWGSLVKRDRQKWKLVVDVNDISGLGSAGTTTRRAPSSQRKGGKNMPNRKTDDVADDS